ncbi:calcium uniporter protein 4, mitochondrial-like [Apium graveolens]|uniref:calcium uniporter protein 4, mitochondrial-like n=1 Tax=Apium graveolens TaxID=4045 RepID=UPI003D7AEF0D
MALRRTISKRFFNKTLANYSPAPVIHQNGAKTNFQRELITSSESANDEKGFFRRFLQRRSINQAAAKLPEFLSVPVGEKLREKLWPINYGYSENRIRFDGLTPPENVGGMSVQEAKKILRSARLEKLRSALKKIPANSVEYSEFVKICTDVCENGEQGLECAKMLDDAGNVIVLGNIVFLRPDQVARSMEKLIYETIATPNDSRKQQLREMEKQKELIDRKAESIVRAELYCGLGFMVVQTLGFMRLTFWELSWDVMEPICFFVTSLHFALAYAFFLRTSKEPTFEGFFQRRFKAKQEKLMKVHNFDVQKYNQLCQAFYPNFNESPKFGDFGKCCL